MVVEKNMEKYERYKKLKVALKKSLQSGFYYEAIFIEYAILEDRSTSVLAHADVNYKDRNGYEVDLKTKLDKIRCNHVFQNNYIRSRLTTELIDSLQAWRKTRNKLIHALCGVTYEEAYVKTVAMKGKELLDLFDNRVSSVNKYLQKSNQ